MMRDQVIELTIDFDTTKLHRVEFTDALNEFLHQFALETKCTEDPSTGGYVEFDWHYDPATVAEGLQQYSVGYTATSELLRRFDTEEEASAYIATLPGFEDGRYYLDGPDTRTGNGRL